METTSTGGKKTTKIILSQENALLRQKTAGWEALGALASRMNSGQPLKAVLNEAVRECSQALSAELFGIMLLDETGTNLEIAASRGLDRGMLPTIPVLDGVSLETAAQNGLPDWAIPETFCEQESDEPSLANSVFLKMAYHDAPLGVLFAARPVQATAFKEDAVRLLHCIANQLSLMMFLEGPARLLMESERIERDLNFAHTLKSKVLPTAMPNVDGYRIVCRTLRSLDSGGDFHDFLPLPDGRFVFLVGETSGRGVQGALNVAHLISSIRFCFAQGLTLEQLMGQLNNQIVEEGRRGQMVSLSAFTLEPKTGSMQVVQVGNIDAYRIAKGEKAFTGLANAHGTPLGVLLGCETESIRCDLEPGGGFVVHTDGVRKCINASGVPYDQDALQQVFTHFHEKQNDMGLADQFADQLLLHNSSEVLSDDATIFSLERLS